MSETDTTRQAGAWAPLPISTLARYMRPQARRLAAITGCLALGVGAQLAAPQMVRVFIDGAGAGAPLDRLLLVAAGFVAAALAGQALAVAVAHLGADVSWRATNALRRDLTRHVLRLDPAYHTRHTPGELVERIEGDVTGLAEVLSTSLGRLAVSALMALGVLVLLAIEDPRIGLALGGFALLYVVVHERGQRIALPHWRRFRAEQAAWSGYIEERVAGLRDIRALGAVEHVLSGFFRLLRPTFWSEIRAEVLTDVGWSISKITYALGYVAALAIGARLYLRGEATIGSVYLVVSYLGLLRDPLSRIGSEVEEIQRARVSAERVAAVLATPSAVPDTGRTPLPAGALGVALEGVSFGYAAEHPILHDVSLALAPGRTLGLLGRTGSGKTTISRLLARFYEPQRGVVRLGGRDIREVPLADLRRRVALVTQEVEILRAALRDNLTLYRPGIDDAALLAALDALGLGEWYTGLPEGLDTRLGADGRGLSAGEAQLVALARALLRDPGLVILDEASSRIDPATARLLDRALDRLLAGRTGIVIAHRLATVARCDAIIVLEEGRIVEHGERVALAADPATRFFRLLHAGIEEVLA